MVFLPSVATALLHTWAFPSFDLFATGLPAVLPLFCSLVPSHWVVFLDAFRIPWSTMGLYTFRPSFHRMGGGSSRRDHSLLRSGPPPLTEVGVVRGPSLPFSWFYRLSSVVARYVSVQFLALSQPLTMSWPAGLGSHTLSWIFLCSLEISRCPLDLPSCISCPLGGGGGGSCRCSLPSGLDARSVRFFWSLVELFLARSLLSLLALASSGFADILHVLHFESLTPELRMMCPSPSSPSPSWRRCWLSSAPWFEGFTVLAIQT